MAEVRSRRAPSRRDQDASPFTEILTTLCAVSGAHCAALVDLEGETVDYAGEGEPFDIRILAAEWRLAMHCIDHSKSCGRALSLVVRARRKSFLIESLPDGYALVVQLGRRATSLSHRALCEARRRLCAEAGFVDDRATAIIWTPVTVQEEGGRSKRPLRIADGERAQELIVIGRVSSEAKGERGFRVRLSSGEEKTLIREPLGHWYLEDERWV